LLNLFGMHRKRMSANEACGMAAAFTGLAKVSGGARGVCAAAGSEHRWGVWVDADFATRWIMVCA
jgi:hypothetical protein